MVVAEVEAISVVMAEAVEMGLNPVNMAMAHAEAEPEEVVARAAMVAERVGPKVGGHPSAMACSSQRGIACNAHFQA